MTLLVICVIVPVFAGMYAVFEKAGIEGWKCLVPVYNALLIQRIIGKPDWWILLLLVPFVNIIIKVIVNIQLAECFGKGQLFGGGLVLLSFIFYPILGFGASDYHPPERWEFARR